MRKSHTRSETSLETETNDNKNEKKSQWIFCSKTNDYKMDSTTLRWSWGHNCIASILCVRLLCFIRLGTDVQLLQLLRYAVHSLWLCFLVAFFWWTDSFCLLIIIMFVFHCHINLSSIIPICSTIDGFIRSTLQSRPNKAGLKRPSVHPPTKFLLISIKYGT